MCFFFGGIKCDKVSYEKAFNGSVGSWKLIEKLEISMAKFSWINYETCGFCELECKVIYSSINKFESNSNWIDYI